MNHVLKSCLVYISTFLTCLLIAYILGAFVNWNLNPGWWDAIYRLETGLWVFLITITSGTVFTIALWSTGKLED